jgi:pimeloyl-ACP methyl ester carboxylesterase
MSAALALAVPAAVVATLLAITAGSTARLNRRYPPTGRLVEAGGIRMHVVEDGPADDARPPVVVIHGASGNLEEARLALGEALAGRRTLFVDRPGHGHSERGDAPMAAPAAQAEAVAGLMDTLGIDRAVLVGHSWGAAVATAMAVVRPDRVAGLVLVAPATHPWPGGVAWYHGIARHPLLGRLFAWTLPVPLGALLLEPGARSVFAPDPMPPAYVDRGRIGLSLRPANFRANSLDIWHLKDNVAAMAPRYREIAVPTVVITGDADSVVWPSIHAEPLAAAIEGAVLVVLPGAGHMPHHAHPTAVVDAVDAVTRRAAAGEPAGARDQMPV